METWKHNAFDNFKVGNLDVRGAEGYVTWAEEMIKSGDYSVVSIQ